MHRCCGNDQCLKSKSNIVYIYKSVSCMSVGSGARSGAAGHALRGDGEGSPEILPILLDVHVAIVITAEVAQLPPSATSGTGLSTACMPSGNPIAITQAPLYAGHDRSSALHESCAAARPPLLVLNTTQCMPSCGCTTSSLRLCTSLAGARPPYRKPSCASQPCHSASCARWSAWKQSPCSRRRGPTISARSRGEPAAPLQRSLARCLTIAVAPCPC